MYENANASGGMLGFLPLMVFLAVYALCSWAQMKMALNLGFKQEAWWAWIPVLNLFLLTRMSDKPAWWFILCFIPLVNLVVLGVMWAKVAQALGLSAAWGVILVFVPIINLFALAKMATAKPPSKFNTPPPARPQQPRQPAQVG